MLIRVFVVLFGIDCCRCCIPYFIEQPVYITVTESTTTASTTTPTTSTSTTSTSTTSTSTTTTSTTTTTTTTVPPCPAGWEFQSFPNTYPACYRLFNDRTTFFDAESQCQMTNYMGEIGHISSVHSTAENNYIIGLTGPGGTGSFFDANWIGAFTISTTVPVSYIYTDGSPYDYTNYGFNGNNNPLTERCMTAVNNPGGPFNSGEWNTLSCDVAARNFVCKIRAAV